jgi:tetratricopeptide (TPR) repeat protein
MTSRWLIRCVASAAVLSTFGVAPAQAAPPFETLGNVTAGKQEADGSAWFETWDEGMRFVLERKYRGQSEALWKLLNQASEQGVAVTVRYDPSAAHFSVAAARFEYPVCSVEFDAMRVESGRSCASSDEVRGTRGGSDEQWIGLALAHSKSGSPRSAIALLDAPLASPALAREPKKIALRSRAEAYESLSNEEQPASEAADRAMVAALADYRKLAALAPDDVEIQLSIGLNLQELGDYEAARSTYELVLKRWPDEDFRTTLRLAGLARQQGDFEGSLKLINGLVERHGAQAGMRFHYHRGWTLNALGRYYEAIADFTEGMKSQPDYSYAYLRRACAQGSVGNLAFALGDIETFARLRSRVPESRNSPALSHDLQRAAEVASSLRALISSGGSAETSDACDGFWGAPDKPRAKSPLLATQLVADNT